MGRCCHDKVPERDKDVLGGGDGFEGSKALGSDSKLVLEVSALLVR